MDTIGIIVEDIDKAIQRFSYSYTRWSSCAEVKASNVLNAKQKAAYDALQKIDAEEREVAVRRKAAKEKFLKLVNDAPFYLDQKRIPKDGWYVYILKETPEAAQKRLEAGEMKRTVRLKKLRDLRERVVLAAANGSTQFGSFVTELQELVKTKNPE